MSTSEIIGAITANIMDWKKSEKKAARLHGLKLMPGSGNQWGSEHDGENEHYKLENKSTKHKSIKLDVLEHLQQANRMRQRGILLIRRLETPHGAVIVVEESDFLRECYVIDDTEEQK